MKKEYQEKTYVDAKKALQNTGVTFAYCKKHDIEYNFDAYGDCPLCNKESLEGKSGEDKP